MPFVVACGLLVVVRGLLSSCGVQVFSSLVVALSSRVHGLCSCGAQAPEHVGSVVCSSQALVEACKHCSCGMRA